MKYPYSDENMIFNSTKRRYVLTENALLQGGINVRSRLLSNGAVAPEVIISRILDHTSLMIYNYIRQFAFDAARRDELIASLPSMRDIIYGAILAQTEYVLLNGDFSRSADPDKRKLAIDENAKLILETALPEIGVPITYRGVL